MAEEAFKVGDTVPIFYRGDITAIDKVKSISPKRGDITLVRTKTKYSDRGSSMGGGTWDLHYSHISHTTKAHRKELDIAVTRKNIKALAETELTDKQAGRLWKVIKDEMATWKV